MWLRYAEYGKIERQDKWTGERANTPGPGHRKEPCDDYEV